MVKVREYDLDDIESELLNRLRYVVNPLDPHSRIQEQTLDLTLVALQTIYHLSNSLSYIKRVVMINAQEEETLLYYGKDYKLHTQGDDMGSVEIFDIDNTFTYRVIYGEVKKNQGKANFVYADFPNRSMDEAEYPRIGFELSVSSRNGGFGANELAYDHDILLQIQVVDSNILRLKDFIKKIDKHLKQYARTFYNFNYVRPINWQNYNNFSDNTQKNKVQMIQFELPRRREIVELLALE